MLQSVAEALSGPSDRTLYVAFDTSLATISDCRRWMQTITDALCEIRPERTYAFTFSDRVHSSMAMEAAFVAMLPTLPIFMSGGTVYDAVFNAVRADRRITGEHGPHRVVIVSDAFGATDQVPSKVEFDVAWLCPGGYSVQPWYGKVLHAAME